MTIETDTADRTTRHAEPARLEYGGVVIRQWDEMLSLTDMWKAARQKAIADGAVASAMDEHKPAQWLRSADAKKFIDAVLEVFNVGNLHIESLVTTTRGGRDPQTRAHWQIGLAYAKYLSPEFHMWCNTVVRERMEGRSVPAGVTILTAEIKALNDRIGPLETALAERDAAFLMLAKEVRAVMNAADPRSAMVTDYVPMLEILKGEGVEKKRRRPFSQRCSSRCRRYLTKADRGDKVRVSRESGKYLFHVDAVKEWLAAEGRQLIREHRALVEGQTVMQFPKPKAVPKAVQVAPALL